MQAGVFFEDVATVDGSWKTIAQLRPAANKPVRILAISIGGKGTVGTTAPFDVRLAWTDPDGSGDTVTPIPFSSIRHGVTTVQTAARKNFGSEPSNIVPFFYTAFHPQGGMELKFVIEDIECDGGDAIALQIQATGATTAVTGTMTFDE